MAGYSLESIELLYDMKRRHDTIAKKPSHPFISRISTTTSTADSAQILISFNADLRNPTSHQIESCIRHQSMLRDISWQNWSSPKELNQCTSNHALIAPLKIQHSLPKWNKPWSGKLNILPVLEVKNLFIYIFFRNCTKYLNSPENVSNSRKDLCITWHIDFLVC